MNISYEIRPYSSFDNWTYRSDTENISNITDRMIRISAKVTEYFACDIVFYINDLVKCVRNHEPYDAVLCFRDGGVNEYKVEDGKVIHGEYIGSVIQVWHLTHDPVTTTTLLVRSYLRADNHAVGL